MKKTKEIKEFVRSRRNITNHHLLPSWVDEPKSSISLLRLKKLERLDLHSNRFNCSTIQSLRLFKSLKTLSLLDNYLEGSFPAKEFKSLSKLSKLKHLDLGGNQFDKEILRSLGALLALTSLKLDYNFIESTLYDQDLASLRSLEVLNLANNHF
ncbi:hypothetical protein CMV_023961 [Castanea mollissima]|uniref:Uncharacterized protein n=1 Tax=Castanea mollissima TaxID=60419 RepID=A0A8J4QPH6_9ROSI|nr:hypothetical protein CMV_023961 [Castanea mollissima]